MRNGVTGKKAYSAATANGQKQTGAIDWFLEEPITPDACVSTGKSIG
jgi:hypothetical protein